jgi:hypothetical protein
MAEGVVVRPEAVARVAQETRGPARTHAQRLVDVVHTHVGGLRQHVRAQQRRPRIEHRGIHSGQRPRMAVAIRGRQAGRAPRGGVGQQRVERRIRKRGRLRARQGADLRGLQAWRHHADDTREARFPTGTQIPSRTHCPETRIKPRGAWSVAANACRWRGRLDPRSVRLRQRSRIVGYWLRPALRALTSADAEISLRRNPAIGWAERLPLSRQASSSISWSAPTAPGSQDFGYGRPCGPWLPLTRKSACAGTPRRGCAAPALARGARISWSAPTDPGSRGFGYGRPCGP